MTKRVRIGVYGASGRMGASVVRLVEDEFDDQAIVTTTIDRKSGQLDNLRTVDAIIDFTLPEGTGALLDWFDIQSGDLPVYVCGTTGLTAAQHARLAKLGDSTIVFQASNFSSGVAALAAILRFATPMLRALSYTPKITEVHHVHKLDAPSGTAKTLCEVIDPDQPASVEVESIRQGEVIGRHDVTFAGAADRIVIAHEAADRSLFARGAIEAAVWLCRQPQASGSYTMESYFQQRFLD